MSAVLTAVQLRARMKPHAPAIVSSDSALSYAELAANVASLQHEFLQQRYSTLGVMMDNSPAWAVVDLAALAAGVTLVALPSFFSEQQIKHAMQDAGIEMVLTDQPDRFNTLQQGPVTVDNALTRFAPLKCKVWQVSVCQGTPQSRHPGIAKITYTSGTTGSPKGVCLARETIERVARSLVKATEMHHTDHHLCLLPLATLLENIGGLYVPLLAGAKSYLYSLASIGINGATRLDVGAMHAALYRSRATTTILIPQMLHAIVESYEAGQPALNELRFVAVGGAPVSKKLLSRAVKYQIPVYEGYGLSECASVVAVNTPTAQRRGSVGRVLPHIQLDFGSDGEIFVAGARYKGYLGSEKFTDTFVATGDIGYVDEDNYLYITGRKKNIFITSYGRNISPEWVERELVLQPAIQQAAIFGEGRPWNTALIVATHDANHQEIQRAIRETNRHLPDYAQVRTWLITDTPFTVSNHQLTATGRLRRDEIWQRYGVRIDAFYDGSETCMR